MTDTFSKQKRSWVMSRIRSGNTKPEMKVRSFLHRLGFRFSLRPASLPGKPDVILRKYNTVVFVHGCFWHHCPHCKGGHLPKSNIAYWKNKLTNNKIRDQKHIEALLKMGWKVIVIWECQANNEENLIATLSPLLKAKSNTRSQL